MKLEVLLSCMYQNDFSIAYRSKVDSDLLIINQCDFERYDEIEVNGHLWRMISTRERGLSKSRNMAIRNAKGDILLLADDDETFNDGYASGILSAYMEVNDADLIVFNIDRINVAMKKNYYHIKKAKKVDNFRFFGSPMVSFKRKFILENNISFSETFGSGTEWGPGEDTLFQKECKKNTASFYEYPFNIATIDYSNESKWFFGYDEMYFYNQGAFSEYCKTPIIKEFLYFIYSSFWKLRKEKKLSPFKKLIWRYKGKKGWRLNVTYREFLANGCRYKSKQ